MTTSAGNHALRNYAGRFLVPLVLLVACVATWVAAQQLGAADRARLPVGSEPGAGAREVSAPLASVRRLPEFATESLLADATANALASLPADPGGLSCAVVLVDGLPILDIRGDRVLVPSFAQLAITGHAAIDVLGPDFRYETRAMAEVRPDANGRLFDALYLVGGGDPVLMTYGYSIGFRPFLGTRSAIEDLADAVVDAGVVRIDGGIVAVERRYDTERILPGLPEQYVSDGIIGPLTALQLDDGFAERAAANGGVAVPSDEPATLAAARFARLLQDRGVEIFGGARTLTEDQELAPLVPIAQLTSPPLGEIVFQMLAVNDASAAEMILKELGLAEGGIGSAQAGARVVQRVLQAQGVPIDLPFRDASGLDPIGGASCRQLAAGIDTIPVDHATLSALPGFDLPGVFDGRFNGAEVTSDLRLVGGIAGDAAGLVARTVDQGRQVTIASIVNRPGGPNATDLEFQQALVEVVDDLRVSVSVEAISTDE